MIKTEPGRSINFVTAFFRAAGWAAVVLIAVLSLVPGEARPHVVASSQLEHVAAYTVAASSLAFGYFGFGNLIALATLLPIYAAVLELLQFWVPGRTARVIDVVAGTAGSWIGISTIVLLHWMTTAPSQSSSRER